MTRPICLSLAALALAMPASLAGQSAQDFQLPPAPTPTPSPNVQGPVDVEGAAVPVRPRAIPTSRPTPVQTPAEAALPRIEPEVVAEEQGAPTRPATAPAVRPSPSPQTAPALSAAPPETSPPGGSAETPVAPLPTARSEAAGPPMADQLEAGAEPRAPSIPWMWAGALGALVALIGAVLIGGRRRAARTAPAELERPIVATNDATAPQPAAPHELLLKAEAIRLTRSLANATLDYRVTLINRSTGALSGVTLSADLVSAHGDLPAEQQVATPASRLDQRHSFARIPAGASVRYEGKLLLSLAQARVIRQGPMALLVPLLRLRLDGVGAEPLVKTFVIGQGVADGGRVAPFRLDEGMRSWMPVAARSLD